MIFYYKICIGKVIMGREAVNRTSRDVKQLGKGRDTQ